MKWPYFCFCQPSRPDASTRTSYFSSILSTWKLTAQTFLKKSTLGFRKQIMRLIGNVGLLHNTMLEIAPIYEYNSTRTLFLRIWLVEESWQLILQEDSSRTSPGPAIVMDALKSLVVLLEGHTEVILYLILYSDVLQQRQIPVPWLVRAAYSRPKASP